MGEVCGALTGAIIVIGLDLAARYRDTAVLRLLNIKFTQKFMRDFAKEFGNVRCRDIIGHDISGFLTPGDEKYAAFQADREIKANGHPALVPLQRLSSTCLGSIHHFEGTLSAR